MKQCSQCKLTKPLTEFWKSKPEKDGLQRRCKDCLRRYFNSDMGKQSHANAVAKYNKTDRKREASKRYENTERGRLIRAKIDKRRKVSGKVRAYRHSERARILLAEAQRRHIQKYPQAVKARRKVSAAISAGKLTKQPCEICGNENAEGHHEDYSKPLTVNWLCLQHHRAIHKLKKESENAKSL